MFLLIDSTRDEWALNRAKRLSGKVTSSEAHEKLEFRESYGVENSY